jgi:hypothetical protein
VFCLFLLVAFTVLSVTHIVCLCSVPENGGEFGDTLWSSDDEALSDGACGSGT